MVVVVLSCISPPVFASTSIATVPFINPLYVRQAWSLLPMLAKTKKASVGCRAGVINHHVLATDQMAMLIRAASACNRLSRVIVLSPDHYQVSAAPIVTHRNAYQVENSFLSADQKGIDRLLRAVPNAREDDRPYWQAEHGIGAIVPFLAQTSTSSSILPVMVRATTDNATLRRFQDWLKKEMSMGAFVLVSSDMSHYLPERRALLNDQKTLQAFTKNQAKFFQQANDDFTDNGKSLAAIINALGKTRWQLVGHDISSRYGGSPGYTTSYITGLWQ